ncbi:MAG: hypothetical protein KH626_07370, partial [Clostridium celatum]|nr:hypothetical protein [Clostridium celatum]
KVFFSVTLILFCADLIFAIQFTPLIFYRASAVFWGNLRTSSFSTNHIITPKVFKFKYEIKTYLGK